MLLVAGGSQGARSINLAVAGAAKELARAGVQVLHVIGARNEPVAIPTDLPVPYVSLPYLSEMELGYAAADLMLGRGGAMTCAEVAAVGLPAVYVPLPARQPEQRRNALPVVEAGGGLLVDDAELTPDVDRGGTCPAAARPAPARGDGRTAAAAYGRRDGDEALLDFVFERCAR